jgi:hypothetical protein
VLGSQTVHVVHCSGVAGHAIGFVQSPEKHVNIAKEVRDKAFGGEHVAAGLRLVHVHLECCEIFGPDTHRCRVSDAVRASRDKDLITS